MPIHHIGTLAEKSLHAALKARYAQPGDQLEYPLGGYVIDIMRPTADGVRCIEIQTGNLGQLKPKLLALMDDWPIHVVFPIAQERTIVRLTPAGDIRSRRKSPKHGSVYQIFPELVSFPILVSHPNFSLEVLLIREEQTWVDDGHGSWRRQRWSIQDRRLLDVLQAFPLVMPADFAALLPQELPAIFDTQELATCLHQPRHLAQKMAYCLRAMGVLELAGKRGNALLYQRSL